MHVSRGYAKDPQKPCRCGSIRFYVQKTVDVFEHRHKLAAGISVAGLPQLGYGGLKL